MRSATGPVLVLLCTTALAATAPAAEPAGWAAINGDVQRGAARSAELYCGVCHGDEGRSKTAEWPSLAGQQPAYLAEQLNLLRAKQRASSEMQPMAATLSDADIVDLASYYAAQPAVAPAPSPEAAPAAPGDELGARLYREGDATRELAACGSCHGANAQGDAAARAPALRAQQPTYVVNQLRAYAQRGRYPQEAPAAAAAMSEAAARLKPEDMTALAAWLHRQR